MEIILGSSSPRRKEILKFFSLPFQVVSPDFDEAQVLFQGDPALFAIEVAKRKAFCVKERFPNQVILTADTIVHQERRLFLKPETMQEAKSMLKELSGKEHQVFTGLCVCHQNEVWIGVEESRVFFHELTDAQIATYHQHIFPLDKAGGYTIEKGGSLIVKRIEGCYYNIMGLPIHTMRSLLLKAGIDLWEYLKSF